MRTRRPYNKSLENSFNQTFTVPMSGIPATTTTPSVRNAVYNLKGVGKTIKDTFFNKTSRRDMARKMRKMPSRMGDTYK